MNLRRGELWLVDLEPVARGELGKRRPCLIVSDDGYNRIAPTLLVMPVTGHPPTARSPALRATAQAGLAKDSSVLPLHVRAVARSRFVHRIGRAPPTVVRQCVEMLVLVVT